MADIRMAVTTVTLPTTTPATFEVTITNLGWTPKACLVVATNAQNDSGTPQDSAALSFGGTDGTNEWVCSVRDTHGVNPSDTDRRSASDETIMLIDNAGAPFFEATGVGDGSGENPGPFADSWRFDATVVPADARIAKVVFLGGGDLSVKADITPVLGVEDSATAITTVGFEPHLVVTAGIGDAIGDAALTQCIFTVGFVHNDVDISQQYISVSGLHSQSPTDNTQRVDNAKANAEVTSGAVGWSAELEAFDSSGFDVRVRDGASGGDKFGYLALNVGEGRAWADSIDSPTDAGADWDVTAPGFLPVGVMLMESFLTAENTTTVDATAFALAFTAFDGVRDHTCGISSADAVSTINTQSKSNAQALDFDRPDGTNEFDGSSPSLESNGWKMTNANLVDADTTARKWIGFAIGASASGSFFITH